MSQRFRIRRILKWAGSLCCVLLVCAWVWNANPVRSHFTYYEPGVGVFRFWHNRIELTVQNPVRNLRYTPGFSIARCPSPNFSTFGSAFSWPPLRVVRGGVSISFWLAVLLVSALTALLWRLDRRRIPPGHCQHCGYNLTGNVSGVCPECGEACKPEAGAQ